jgi:hypothetical protein
MCPKVLLCFMSMVYMLPLDPIGSEVSAAGLFKRQKKWGTSQRWIPWEGEMLPPLLIILYNCFFLIFKSNVYQPQCVNGRPQQVYMTSLRLCVTEYHKAAAMMNCPINNSSHGINVIAKRFASRSWYCFYDFSSPAHTNCSSRSVLHSLFSRALFTVSYVIVPLPLLVVFPFFFVSTCSIFWNSGCRLFLFTDQRNRFPEKQ